MKCYICHKVGHIARYCRQNQKTDAGNNRDQTRENMKTLAAIVTEQSEGEGEGSMTIGACLLDGMHN
jgi:hypothetical protein